MDHQQAFLGDGFAGDLGVLRRFALFHLLAMAQRRRRIQRFGHCGSALQSCSRGRRARHPFIAN
jgi:hypothetical protein